ncbi:hypothetical protein HYZ06_01100 [Candidatus Daviesbacteria bacterium]|nr:hypothetical protein [Candidatus Daviesbacteria bacterium]
MISKEILGVLEDIAAILHTGSTAMPSGAYYVYGKDVQEQLVLVRARQETPTVAILQAEIASRGGTRATLQLLNPTIRRIERPGDNWIRIFGAEGTFLISPQLGAHISHGPQGL